MPGGIVRAVLGGVVAGPVRAYDVANEAWGRLLIVDVRVLRLMGLSVLFVSGPRRTGKSALIRTMLDRSWRTPPHYIRLLLIGGDKQPPKNPPVPSADSGVASATWLEYDMEQVFDVLPGALCAIHKRDRYGSVVIEADADPVLRCAYPYDYRVFVMPCPDSVHDVFRESTEAAAELKHVLEDTAAFASEIFGLFAGGRCLDADPPEERSDLTATQMRGFLHSPLGDELATRIQLQPPYHGLVESDVVLMNTAVGAAGPAADECVCRIERLFDRIRGSSDRRAELFRCDPHDIRDKTCQRLYNALRPMCVGGR